MMHLRRLAPLVAIPWFVSCADDETNPFDPSADVTPPAVTEFEMVVQDGLVVALWAASEPVRAVVSTVDPAGATRHSYPSARGFAEAGMIRVVGLESNTGYEVAGVRLSDRAGNETQWVPEEAVTFDSGALNDEQLLYLAMIDVGWGDSIYLEAPDGTNVLIDAGHPEDGPRVRAFLARKGVNDLDFASLTHVHEDHIGGFYGEDFPDVFEGLLGNTTARIPIGTFLDIADKTPGTINGPYNQLQGVLAPLETAGMQHLYLEPGASSETGEPALAWGEGLRVDLLAAGQKDFLLPEFILGAEAGSVQNNDSMVYRVQFGSFVAILTGDAEFASEQYMENRWPREFLQATVLKLGHHGSNDSNSERFLRFVDPMVALIPNAISENPGVEHPFVLTRLRNRGVDYFASDRAIPNRDRALPGARGDIQILTDGDALTVLVDNLSYE